MTVTVLEPVAEEAADVLTALHSRGCEILRHYEEDKSIDHPVIREDRIIDSRKLLTILNRAVDSCIKWRNQ